MKISVPTENGFLPEKYSKHSDVKINGKPVMSFPIDIEGVPENAASLALVYVDFDSVPVCGFVWIHWTAANIPANVGHIPENASQTEAFGMVQGTSSCASRFVGETDKRLTRRYNGPTPPNKDHKYKLTVYALDCELELDEGFFLNELMEKMDGHILDKTAVIIPAHC
ncbi:MAG: YbhB/YbcL family Raf kinase inhibitor-like protein [Oscillospiraceae bacterium]|nr:YbhB/YbcL family Raf kinase inhibitor-like protein [Oscillospiraceae bacterium]